MRGGDGAAHSSVVACHGFAAVGTRFEMLQKKLKMKGSWKNVRIDAPHEDTTFRWRIGCAKS